VFSETPTKLSSGSAAGADWRSEFDPTSGSMAILRDTRFRQLDVGWIAVLAEARWGQRVTKGSPR